MTRDDDDSVAPDLEDEPTRWDELGLSNELVELVEKAGYDRPTPIQRKAIPIALEGKDLIASARTGSGKTAGFCLPIIEKLIGKKGMVSLILCPTRELALQTHETIEKFGAPLGVRSVAFIGGVNIKLDLLALRENNPQILVGTPGRITDHLDRGNLWLEYIEMLVLDEADQMLDMGFAKAVSRIVGEINKDRQTFLFSATFSSSIERLAREILFEPVKVAIEKGQGTPSTIEQEFYWVNERTKNRALLNLIKEETGSILVFTRTKSDATNLFRWLHAKGIHDISFISSDRQQAHREQALQGFKEGIHRVLVATDVAGRGIHVEDISCVINYELPKETDDYIHRIGRTGRKGAEGKAISFVTVRDTGMIRRIEGVLGKRIPERFAPDFNPDNRDSRPAGRGPTRHRPSPGRGSSRGGPRRGGPPSREGREGRDGGGSRRTSGSDRGPRRDNRSSGGPQRSRPRSDSPRRDESQREPRQARDESMDDNIGNRRDPEPRPQGDREARGPSNRRPSEGGRGEGNRRPRGRRSGGNRPQNRGRRPAGNRSPRDEGGPSSNTQESRAPRPTRDRDEDSGD